MISPTVRPKFTNTSHTVIEIAHADMFPTGNRDQDFITATDVTVNTSIPILMTNANMVSITGFKLGIPISRPHTMPSMKRKNCPLRPCGR